MENVDQTYRDCDAHRNDFVDQTYFSFCTFAFAFVSSVGFWPQNLMLESNRDYHFLFGKATRYSVSSQPSLVGDSRNTNSKRRRQCEKRIFELTNRCDERGKSPTRTKPESEPLRMCHVARRGKSPFFHSHTPPHWDSFTHRESQFFDVGRRFIR